MIIVYGEGESIFKEPDVQSHILLRTQLPSDISVSIGNDRITRRQCSVKRITVRRTYRRRICVIPDFLVAQLANTSAQFQCGDFGNAFHKLFLINSPSYGSGKEISITIIGLQPGRTVSSETEGGQVFIIVSISYPRKKGEQRPFGFIATGESMGIGGRTNPITQVLESRNLIRIILL